MSHRPYAIQSIWKIAERLERLPNDANGNPRYRAHWLDFLGDIEAMHHEAPRVAGESRARELGWSRQRGRAGANGWMTIQSHIGREGLAQGIYEIIARESGNDCRAIAGDGVNHD